MQNLHVGILESTILRIELEGQPGCGRDLPTTGQGQMERETITNTSKVGTLPQHLALKYGRFAIFKVI